MGSAGLVAASTRGVGAFRFPSHYDSGSEPFVEAIPALLNQADSAMAIRLGHKTSSFSFTFWSPFYGRSELCLNMLAFYDLGYRCTHGQVEWLAIHH
jgi:hypothetical protein